MSKKSKILSVSIGLLIAGAVVVFAMVQIGKDKFQQIYMSLVESQDVPEQVKFGESKFEQSFLATKVVTKATINDGAKKIEVEFVTNVNHLPGFSKNGLYLFKQKTMILPSPEVKQILAQALEDELQLVINAEASWGGILFADVKMSPIRPKGSKEFQLNKGLVFSIAAPIDTKIPKYLALDIPHFAFQDGRESGEIEDFRISFDTKYSISGAGLDFVIKTGKVKTDDGQTMTDFKNSAMALKIKGVNAGPLDTIVQIFEAEIKGQKAPQDPEKLVEQIMTNSTKFVAEATMSATGTVKNASAMTDVSFDNFRLLLGSYREGDSLRIAFTTDFDQANINAIGSAIPLKKSEIRLNLKELAWPKAADLAALADSPQTPLFTSKSHAEFSANLSAGGAIVDAKSYFDGVTSKIVEPNPSQISGEANAKVQKSFVALFPMLDAVMAPYFKLEGDTYTAQFKVIKGKAELNGQPFPAGGPSISSH